MTMASLMNILCLVAVALAGIVVLLGGILIALQPRKTRNDWFVLGVYAAFIMAIIAARLLGR